MELIQPVTQEHAVENLPAETVTPRRVTISLEWAAYAVLVALALTLRLAQLDAVPLSDSEARQALAAWRVVYPDAAGVDIIPESPLLFLLHSLTFSVLGATEAAARIATVLGSVGLILSPLLFRDLLGRGRAFLFSLILTFSPILLIASRSDSPVIWSLLAAVLGLWGYWRYHLGGRAAYAVFSTVCFAGLVLLIEPAGLVLALALVGAGVFALVVLRPPAESEDGEAGFAESQPPLRERLGSWPWSRGLLISLLVAVLVATLFMLYPAGLSSVSEVLGGFIRGLTVQRPGVPGFAPFSLILFYEPVIAILGVAAIFWLARRDLLIPADRFLIGWLVGGLIASTLYAGIGAEHALWLTVPLAGLVSALAAGLMRRSYHLLWWDAPNWSRWLVAAVAFMLLSMFAIHVQALGRALLNIPLEAISPLTTLNAASVVWVIITLLFMVIGFFLAASVWGLGITAQGALLGLLAFSLLTGMGSGWNASAGVMSESPVELWNQHPTSRELFQLRATLAELSNRETGGFPYIPLTVLAPEDGAVAWALRDYVNTTFIDDVSEARAQPIVLLPLSGELPDLGGDYVGQQFLLRQAWNPGTVRPGDFLAWWTQRRTRFPAAPLDVMVLWLRQDIYNGVQPDAALG